MSREAFLDTVRQRKVSPVLAHDYWYRDHEQQFSLLLSSAEVETLGSRAYSAVIPMRDFLDAHGSGAFQSGLHRALSAEFDRLTR